MPRLRDEKGHFLGSSKNYDYLLSFESMQNWDMSLRSPKTKDLYYRTMHIILNWSESKSRGLETPEDLLKLTDSEAVDLIRRFSHWYAKQEKHKMAELAKTILKSFFTANNRELKSPHLKVRKVPKTSRTHNRIVPTEEQVYLMADAVSHLKDKAVILMLWQSGLRNATFRSLTVRHVKEGLLKNEVPLMIEVTPDIDKKSLGEEYYTFIDRSGVEALRRYLNTRGNLADLDEKEPLFLSNFGVGRGLSDTTLRRIVKKATKNAGLDERMIWPHCLRAAFYNMLVGKVDDVEREFMFGHSMGVRTHYFAPQFVEKLRSAYSRVEWSRPGVGVTREEVRSEVISTLLGKYGDDELEPIARNLGITPEEIRVLIKRLRPEPVDDCQKIVSEEELPNYLQEGWRVVTALPSGNVIIED